MRVASRLVLALLFTIPAACGPKAQPSADGGSYWSCQAIAGATLYMSDIFPAAAKREEITAAFFHMLNSKYGYRGVATCSMFVKSDDTLKQLRAQNERTVKFYHDAGREVVETGWRY